MKGRNDTWTDMKAAAAALQWYWESVPFLGQHDPGPMIGPMAGRAAPMAGCMNRQVRRMKMGVP